MNAEQWSHINELFHEALELTPDNISDFLDSVRSEEPFIADELEKLLNSHYSSGTFLNDKILLDDIMMGGELIGPWKIINELGRGGMSMVYRAERDDGQFERTVAIKFLHGIMPGKEMRTRLQNEQKILAKLRHKNIAQLLDAGVTNEGRPYFILEHVDGIPVTDWCIKNKLTVSERLKIFEQTCEAVQFAHQRLIVHRDLKPTNILVDKNGVVKLLDFGIAKILEETSDSEIPVTKSGYNLMTPRYASPEQIHNDTITTATDVYSLGILLCEMLTGNLPYNIDKVSPVEIGRVITTTIPVKPSALAFHIESNGDGENRHGVSGLDPVQLKRKLRGDLDNIILKAIRKEPERRYSSAEQFLQDIQNYNKNLPVIARPENILYKANKFILRHKAGVAAAALIAISLLASALYSARQAHHAELESLKAQAVNEFLVDLLSAADPRDQGRDVRVVSLIDLAAERLDFSFNGQQDVEAQLRHTLGITYRELGLYPESKNQFSKALAIRKSLFKETDKSVIESLNELGLIYLYMGNYAESDSLLTLAFNHAEKTLPANDIQLANLLSNLGYINYRLGDLDKSAAFHRKSVEIRRAQPEPDLVEISAGMGNVAIVLADLGEYDEAIEFMLQQLEIYRQILEPNSTRIARALVNIASVYRDLERYDEALISNYESIEIFSDAVGEDNSDFAWALGDLGNTLTLLERHNEAETVLRESLQLFQQTLGINHPRVSYAHIRLARILSINGYTDEAIENLRQAITVAERAGFTAESRLIQDAVQLLSELQ